MSNYRFKIVDGAQVALTEAEIAEFEAKDAAWVPPRRPVPKSLVIQRLIDAGKIGAAKAALDANASAYARWWAPDRPNVYADDPEAIALLNAIGADPDKIMAP